MTRNLSPIRDPLALAIFLNELRSGIPWSDDVGCALLYRSELTLLAIALDTHAAEVAIKAKRAWSECQDEPNIALIPPEPWVDPRQPGGDPPSDVIKRAVADEVARQQGCTPGRRVPSDSFTDALAKAVAAGAEDGETVRVRLSPSPSASGPSIPSCSPAFGIADSTRGTGSDSG